MNIRSQVTKIALVSSVSALVLLLSGCDQTKNIAPAADATAAQSTAAANVAGSKDCNAPGVSCTPAERGRSNGEGMEGSGHAQGMERGREAVDDGMRMGGPPERR